MEQARHGEFGRRRSLAGRKGGSGCFSGRTAGCILGGTRHHCLVFHCLVFHCLVFHCLVFRYEKIIDAYQVYDSSPCGTGRA